MNECFSGSRDLYHLPFPFNLNTCQWTVSASIFLIIFGAIMCCIYNSWMPFFIMWIHHKCN